MNFKKQQRVENKPFQKHGHGKSKQNSSYPKKVHTPMPFSCKTKEMIEIQANRGTQCKIKGGRRPEAAAPLY